MEKETEVGPLIKTKTVLCLIELLNTEKESKNKKIIKIPSTAKQRKKKSI